VERRNTTVLGDADLTVAAGLGAYTGDFPNSSCDVGIPDQGFAPQPYDHLVDVDYGMVVLLLNLGGADSHLFRILDTGIRYVHTLTVQ